MNNQVEQISVNDIIPNRFQPRKNFDEESLNELADSIRQHGLIQPLVLRKLGDKYEIIAGERRFKAANIIGLKTVPSIVMEINDADSAEIALVENIQRKDLTAIEEAKSYEKILELGQMNQEELAKRVGKTQSTVSNKLRLLNLSDEAQQALLDTKISERHARSLLKLKDKTAQNEMLNKIIENRLTVRETDNEIKNMLGNDTPQDTEEDSEIIDFQIDTPASPEASTDNVDTPNIEVEPTPISIEGEQDMNQNNVDAPPIDNNINQENSNINNQNNLNQMPISDVPNPLDINNQPIPQPSQPSEPPVFGGTPMNQDVPNNPAIMQDPNQMGMQNGMAQQNNESIGGRFFNNLDDEAANMNMGNTFNPNNATFDPNQFGNPNINEHQIEPNNNFMQEPPAFGSPNQAGLTGMPPMTEAQPTSFIAQQDITGAVAVIRNTVVNLQNNGYIINVDEQDMGTTHQIVINIQK